MSDIKQPQDRKQKIKLFTFDHDDKTYTLPLASDGAENVPGQATRDAIMSPDDEAAQMRLGFALLEATAVPEATLKVLYSKPTPEMLRILGEWMQYGDGSGATVPQS